MDWETKDFDGECAACGCPCLYSTSIQINGEWADTGYITCKNCGDCRPVEFYKPSDDDRGESE